MSEPIFPAPRTSTRYIMHLAFAQYTPLRDDNQPSDLVARCFASIVDVRKIQGRALRAFHPPLVHEVLIVIRTLS